MAQVNYSGLWDFVDGEAYSQDNHGRNIKRALHRLFRKRRGRYLAEIIQAQFDSENKALTEVRVKAKSGLTNDLGGTVEMETHTIIESAAVATADKTDLKTYVLKSDSKPATYPTDSALTGGFQRSGI